MATRRARISARPNLSRGGRDASTSTPPTTVADKQTTEAKPAEPALQPVSVSEPESEANKRDVQESTKSVTADSDVTESNKLPGELLEGTEKPAAEVGDNSDNVTNPKEVASAKSSNTENKPVTRRAKIQARPSISRKPRQVGQTDLTKSENSESTTGAETATSNSDIPDTATSELVSTSSSFKLPEPSTQAIVADLPPLTDKEGADVGPEAEATKIRHFKPKTKPNVIEAGRARMRRLSESLDLSLHVTSPARRHRHTSQPTHSDTSESVIEVVPINSSAAKSVTFESDNIPAGAFSKATAEAKKRSLAGDAGVEAEIDREIIEQEHAELLASGELDDEPKAKKSRKLCRRVIKSDQAPDTATMTIKDLLYYQPTSNPLPQKEDRKNAESRRKSTTSSESVSAVETAVSAVETASQEAGSDVTADGEVAAAEDQTDQLAPQLMIGDDGQIIINQQSLTIETEASKQSIDYEDVSLDRGDEGATYASFRASRSTKFWTTTETAQFYKALNAVGTDFSLMCQLFPKRTRTELKNKFKKEEKTSLGKIELAMAGKLNFDVEPFPEEVQKTKEKPKEKEKVDKRGKRGGRKVRTYYDVGDTDQFRKEMVAKRRRGMPMDRTYTDNSEPPEHGDTSQPTPSKKKNMATGREMTSDVPVISFQFPQHQSVLHSDLLANQASANSSVDNSQSASFVSQLNNQQSTQSDTSAAPSCSLQPVKPTAVRPMPSIATMLHQNEKINQKIAKLLKSSSRVLPQTPPTNNKSDVSMSPLYNLDSGETIMVRTQKLSGTGKKVHHLYLYTPPRPDGTGNMATPLSTTVNMPHLSNIPTDISNKLVVQSTSDIAQQVIVMTANQSADSPQVSHATHTPLRVVNDGNMVVGVLPYSPVTSDISHDLARLATPSPIRIAASTIAPAPLSILGKIPKSPNSKSDLMTPVPQVSDESTLGSLTTVADKVLEFADYL